MKSMLNKKFDLNLVSVHRRILYGFSALIILIFHMDTHFPGFLGALQKRGVVGVEIFVLLTGFGLFHSMEKTPRAGAFYKKRFLRVFPPAFLVTALYYGLQPGSLLGFAARVTFLPYWLGKNGLWFVSFILTMYLIYPPIYFLQKKHGSGFLWLLFGLSSAAGIAASCFDNAWTDVTLRGVCRIPVFFLSCIAAPHIVRKEKIPMWVMPVSLAAGLLLTAAASATPIAYYAVRTASLIFLAVFCIMALSLVGENFTRGTIRGIIYRHFAFLGDISLEIYLVFTRLRRLLMATPAYQAGEIGLFKLEILTALLTPVAAVLLLQLCRYLVNFITSQAVPAPRKCGE